MRFLSFFVSQHILSKEDNVFGQSIQLYISKSDNLFFSSHSFSILKNFLLGQTW